MKIGDLCKVKSYQSHNPSQAKDLILITQPVDQLLNYVTAINLRTLKLHHYTKKELEVLNESR